MKVTMYRCIAPVLLLCIGGFALADGRVAVSGRIVDYLARPVAGAEVAIYEDVYELSVDRHVARLRDEVRRTDTNGRFSFTADVAPSYQVYLVARKEGLALGWDCPVFTDNNVLVLERPCVLGGIVVDSVGHPVAAAKVRAAPKSTYLRRLEQSPILGPEPWLTAETDSRGRFLFKNFAPDVSVDFSVQAPGRTLTYEYSTHWLTVCGYEAGRTDIRLVLPEEVAVHGQVVDAQSGGPVADARVLLHPGEIRDRHANPYLPNLTISGKDGRFTFKGVPPGKHYIDVSAPYDMGLVDRRVRFGVRPSQDVGEMVAHLNRGGVIEIEAREERTEEPIPNLFMYFHEAVQNEQSSFYKDAQTGADGMLRIQAPAALCKFSTGLDGYSPRSYEDQVLVTAGQNTKWKVVLRRYPEVSGLVLDKDGRPVSGAAVNQVFADPAGRFEAPVPSEDSPFSAWIARSARDNLAAIVDFEDDDKPVQITLKPALTISGRITDPNGVGIPAARVALHMMTSEGLTPYAPEIVVDSQGRYEIKAVVPGHTGVDYRISVNASGYGVRWYKKISIDGEPGTHVTLDPIVLQPADRSVTGIVMDAKGHPAPAVALVCRAADQPLRYAATDSNGRFVIRRVCKGPLRIQAGFSDVREEYGFLRAEGGDRDVKVTLGQDGVHPRPGQQIEKSADKEK
jgi:protocatechuate 3,4-dioxygenase beta subunit